MKILTCEGYKMFEGKMIIKPKTNRQPFIEEGTWLYKPDMKCWYANGRSFPEEICCILNEDREGIVM